MVYEPLENPEEDIEKIMKSLGPMAVSSRVNELLQVCWFSLPKEKKTIDELESHVHALISRAIENMRSDERER